MPTPTCACGLPVTPGLACCPVGKARVAAARPPAPKLVRLPASTRPWHSPTHGRWRPMGTGAVLHGYTGQPLRAGGRPPGYARG